MEVHNVWIDSDSVEQPDVRQCTAVVEVVSIFTHDNIWLNFVLLLLLRVNQG